MASTLKGYRIAAMPDANSAFMPTAKSVLVASGVWMDNYQRWPATMAFPAMAFGGMVLAIILSARRHTLSAFLASGLGVAGIVITAGAAMFPFVMPSSLAPSSSLTAWDAVASARSLSIMFWVVVIMLPIVMAYTAWVYRVMHGKVTTASIQANEHASY